MLVVGSGSCLSYFAEFYKHSLLCVCKHLVSRSEDLATSLFCAESFKYLHLFHFLECHKYPSLFFHYFKVSLDFCPFIYLKGRLEKQREIETNRHIHPLIVSDKVQTFWAEDETKSPDKSWGPPVVMESQVFEPLSLASSVSAHDEEAGVRSGGGVPKQGTGASSYPLVSQLAIVFIFFFANSRENPFARLSQSLGCIFQ